MTTEPNTHNQSFLRLARAIHRRPSRRVPWRWLVVALLLVQFAIRSHNLTAQDPFIDESYHILRASVVWDFDANPGRFANGKVLLYFWLGLFESSLLASVFTSRMAIALFSLVSGAAIYQIGRLLYNRQAGVLALALYMALPLAFFHERLALADPFASAFACLAVWRSLTFARRSSAREGIILGALLALTTLAKLTLGLLPLLPVAAAIIYAPWRSVRGLRLWIKAYVPPLAIAAGVVILAWAPLAVPAYLARNSDNLFVLVNSFNVQAPHHKALALRAYTSESLALVRDFTDTTWLALALAAPAAWVALSRRDSRQIRSLAVLAVWLALTVGLVLVSATLTSARYFMPASPPLALLIALGVVGLLEGPGRRRVVGIAALAATTAWTALFAAPFVDRTWTSPFDLPLHGINYNEYLSGWITSDDAVRAVADQLNSLDPAPDAVYASFTLCELMYFYTDLPLVCLPQIATQDDLIGHLEVDLAPGEAAYFVSFNEDNALLDTPTLRADLIGWFERSRTNRPIWLWKVWWKDDIDV